MRTLDSSAATMVATELRKAIVSGELSAGEQIRQAEWAEQLRVSKVPVREALKSLTAEGILTHDHNRAYFVVRFGPSEAAQIFSMRGLIQTELIKSMEWPSRQALVRLRGLARKTAAAIVDVNRDMDVCLELDRQFVTKWQALSPLELVRLEADRLWTLSNVYRRLSALASYEMSRKHARFYTDFVDALEARDRARMIRLVTAEGRAAQAFFVRLLQQRGPSRSATAARKVRAAAS